MKIKVTQGHIDKALEAKRNSVEWNVARECPLARAFTDAMPYTSKPWGVSISSAHAGTMVRSASFELPEEALKFRWAFDAGQPVKPFTFEI